MIRLPRTDRRMNTEHQEIRFGVIAVKKGFVKPDQIVYALNIQVSEDLKSGQHRPIGTILLDQEIITLKQFEEVLQLVNDYDEMGNKDETLADISSRL